MNWPLKTIGELSEVVTKGTTPTSIGHSFIEMGVNYVKVESISPNGFFIESKLAKISSECHADLKRSQLKSGDILFSIAGALGRTALVTDNLLPANTNQALAIIRLKSTDAISLKFLEKALSTGFVLEQVEKHRGGAAQQNLSLTQIKSFKVPVPPLPEQERIVGVLDEAFEGIATATAQAEKNLQNARELFQSVLQSTFSQKGDDWVEAALGDVCDFQGGSQPPKSEFSKSDGAGFVRLIQIRDYKSDNKKVYVLRSSAKRFCSSDDIMIGRYGPPVFQILRGLEGAYNVALMKAVPNESVLTKDFLFYFLQSPRIQNYVIKNSERAAGQTGINKRTIEPFQIVIPPLIEQERIAGVLNKILEETKRLEAIYQRKLDALAELKQSLLQRAFTGQL